MTIGSGVPYNEHTGNGVTTTFSYGFTLLDDGDLVVTIDGVVTSAYTVTGVGDANGGTVVFTTAPASSAAILIQRVIALVRATEYQGNGDLLAETLNDDFDRPWMAIQGISAKAGGSIRAPYPEQVMELPSSTLRANRLLAFDSLGRPTVIAGADTGSAAALALDLLDDSSAAKNSGLVAYLVSLAYARGTVGHRLQQVRLLTSDFGLAESNTPAQNDTAFAAARAWAAANAPCKIIGPQGRFEYTDAGNWAISGVSLQFDFTELVCTSTTAGHTALLIHAFEGGGAPTDPIIHQVNLSGNLIITGNSLTAYGVRWYGLGRVKNSGSIRFREGDPVAGRAFSIEACSACDFGTLICSTDVDPVADGWTMPYYGIYGDTGTRAGTGLGASTNNSVKAMDMAGVSIGVNLVSADQWRFEGGTSESSLVRGVNLTAGARLCHFDGVAMEGTVSDVVDAGFSNRFTNCYSTSAGGAIFQGRNGVISGGLWERIELQSDSRGYDTSRVWIGYSHLGSGGYFDSGKGNTWSNLYGQAVTASFTNLGVMTVTAVTAGVNLQVGQTVYVTDDTSVERSTTIASLGTGTGGTGTYNLTSVAGWNMTTGALTARGARVDGELLPFKDRVSITVGASPFTWTNETGGWVELVYLSGTMSSVTRTRNGAAFGCPTASVQQFLVGPGESVVTTYSSLPSMSYLPMNGLPG